MLKVTVILVICVTLGASSIKQRPPTLEGRIVGGHDVDISDYPYQLSLLYNTHYLCGAALISPTWGITAAHCVDYADVEHVFVRAGSSQSESGGEVIKVSNLILHPLYDESKVDYDIALLELSSAVTITNSSPVALPETDESIPEGTMAIVTGWGSLNTDGDYPDVLQEVEVPIVSQADCRSAFPKIDITERMFCAGFLTVGGKDACHGDSGGPLVVGGVLIGIISWGLDCADPNYPGVYANVSVFRTWIQEVAGL